MTHTWVPSSDGGGTDCPFVNQRVPSGGVLIAPGFVPLLNRPRTYIAACGGSRDPMGQLPQRQLGETALVETKPSFSGDPGLAGPHARPDLGSAESRQAGRRHQGAGAAHHLEIELGTGKLGTGVAAAVVCDTRCRMCASRTGAACSRRAWRGALVAEAAQVLRHIRMGGVSGGFKDWCAIGWLGPGTVSIFPFLIRHRHR